MCIFSYISNISLISSRCGICPLTLESQQSLHKCESPTSLSLIHTKIYFPSLTSVSHPYHFYWSTLGSTFPTPTEPTRALIPFVVKFEEWDPKPSMGQTLGIQETFMPHIHPKPWWNKGMRLFSYISSSFSISSRCGTYPLILESQYLAISSIALILC